MQQSCTCYQALPVMHCAVLSCVTIGKTSTSSAALFSCFYCMLYPGTELLLPQLPTSRLQCRAQHAVQQRAPVMASNPLACMRCTSSSNSGHLNDADGADEHMIKPCLDPARHRSRLLRLALNCTATSPVLPIHADYAHVQPFGMTIKVSDTLQSHQRPRCLVQSYIRSAPCSCPNHPCLLQ
jgi:hypothetical protein